MTRTETTALLKLMFAMHPHVEITEIMVEAGHIAMAHLDARVAWLAFTQLAKEAGRVHPVQPGEIIAWVEESQRTAARQAAEAERETQRRIEERNEKPLTKEQRQTLADALRGKYPELFR